MFQLCLVDGHLDESRVRLVVRQVIQSQRRGCLLLLKQFYRFLQQEVARRKAEIESAVPLTNDLRTRLQTSLTDVYGRGLAWAFEETPALIGGLRVKVGSDVYDGSVRYALLALGKSFGITTANGRRIAS